MALQPVEAGKDVLDLLTKVYFGEQAVAHAHDGPPLGGQVHTVGLVQLPVAVHPAASMDVYDHRQRAVCSKWAVQVQRVHGVAAGQIGEALQDLHPCGERLRGQADGVPPAVGRPFPADQGAGQVSHSRLLPGEIKNSSGRWAGAALFRFEERLALRNGAHGAGTSAGTAVQASTGVDHVMIITLRNGAHGAGIRAGTTADASIANDISHWKYTSLRMYLLFYHIFLKMQC